MLHDIDIRKREARAITGVDIDTDTLGGMIKSLQNSIENLQKIEKQIVTDENQTLDDVFSDEFADIKFDKQDELDKYDKSNLLNLSLHFALSKLASAYVDPASKTPGELNTAIFGYSNADSFLLQSVKDYEEKEAAIAL
jgi:23S rRNA U2552 (ribose-2'-O)-methylase RlmE/FtsJ